MWIFRIDNFKRTEKSNSNYLHTESELSKLYSHLFYCENKAYEQNIYINIYVQF